MVVGYDMLAIVCVGAKHLYLKPICQEIVLPTHYGVAARAGDVVDAIPDAGGYKLTENQAHK